MKMVDLEHDDDFTSVAYKTNTNFKQMSWQFKKLLDKAIKELREFLLIVIDKTKQEFIDLNEQTQEESYIELFVAIDKVKRDYTDLVEQLKIFFEDTIQDSKDRIEQLEQDTQTINDRIDDIIRDVNNLTTRVENLEQRI